MELAFELPDHLPRSKSQQPHTSTAVLTALAAASPVTLADTTKWVNELNQAILETKKDIHDRIHQDFDAFQRQLVTSKSIQRRLAILTSNVHALGEELNNDESGVLPTMLTSLRHHSDLGQRMYEAELASTSLQYLAKCKAKHLELSHFVEERNLPNAVATGAELQELLDSCPFPLNKSKTILDLQNLTRHSKHSVQEQLLKASVECISLTDTRFSIHPQYRSFQLHDIFISVPKDVLSTILTTIRKEILTLYVDRVLREGIQLTPISKDTLEVQPRSSPDRFPALLNIFAFIHDRLLPSLPDAQRSPFAASFYVGLSEAIQTQLLATSIPDNIDILSQYLVLIRAAVDFESQVTKMGFFAGAQYRIRAWADGAQTHYEKKRRATLVDKARLIILTDNCSPVRATLTTTKGITEEIKTEPHTEPPEEEVNWDFDDEEVAKVQENGHSSKPETSREEPDEEEAEGGGDGWGFDDEDEPLDKSATKEDTEDPNDPWGIEWDDPVFKEPKGKPPVVAESKPSFSSRSTNGQSIQTAASTPKTPLSTALPETYLVSHAAASVAKLAGQILEEAMALSKSTTFTEHNFPFAPSALLLSTAPSIFDLFRAMYPISHASEIQHERSRRLQYSNDAKYLADTAHNLRAQYDSVQFAKSDVVGDRFDETAERLEVVGASWLDETIDEGFQRLVKLMSNSGSFMDLAYDAQFAEAEKAIKRVKNEIVLISQDFAVPLAPSVRYASLGTIVDQIIDQMIKDIFAIRDISEIVSERLATLCRILHPLDTLFPELDNGVSTVASHVPLWLKFTYLSDILEGSIAEISSWWDAGHLVDYEPVELSRLTEALFADTPLRATTISKILRA